MKKFLFSVLITCMFFGLFSPVHALSEEEIKDQINSYIGHPALTDVIYNAMQSSWDDGKTVEQNMHDFSGKIEYTNTDNRIISIAWANMFPNADIHLVGQDLQDITPLDSSVMRTGSIRLDHCAIHYWKGTLPNIDNNKNHAMTLGYNFFDEVNVMKDGNPKTIQINFDVTVDGSFKSKKVEDMSVNPVGYGSVTAMTDVSDNGVATFTISEDTIVAAGLELPSITYTYKNSTSYGGVQILTQTVDPAYQYGVKVNFYIEHEVEVDPTSTGGFVIKKIEKKVNSDDPDKYVAATFELYKGDTLVGTYTTTTSGPLTVTTDAEGNPLASGTYTLKEVASAPGYLVNSQQQTVVIPTTTATAIIDGGVDNIAVLYRNTFTPNWASVVGKTDTNEGSFRYDSTWVVPNGQESESHKFAKEKDNTLGYSVSSDDAYTITGIYLTGTYDVASTESSTTVYNNENIGTDLADATELLQKALESTSARITVNAAISENDYPVVTFENEPVTIWVENNTPDEGGTVYQIQNGNHVNESTVSNDGNHKNNSCRLGVNCVGGDADTANHYYVDVDNIKIGQRKPTQSGATQKITSLPNVTTNPDSGDFYNTATGEFRYGLIEGTLTYDSANESVTVCTNLDQLNFDIDVAIPFKKYTIYVENSTKNNEGGQIYQIENEQTVNVNKVSSDGNDNHSACRLGVDCVGGQADEGYHVDVKNIAIGRNNGNNTPSQKIQSLKNVVSNPDTGDFYNTKTGEFRFGEIEGVLTYDAENEIVTVCTNQTAVRFNIDVAIPFYKDVIIIVPTGVKGAIVGEESAIKGL